ncbi:hypothetical protein HBZS_113690 [Helicobacter bizzozeronii CCUG 35545]|nr:hypothetical protein HBZS_113690 [Helicobacter bizzozeronii CCUG 35545]
MDLTPQELAQLEAYEDDLIKQGGEVPEDLSGVEPAESASPAQTDLTQSPNNTEMASTTSTTSTTTADTTDTTDTATSTDTTDTAKKASTDSTPASPQNAQDTTDITSNTDVAVIKGVCDPDKFYALIEDNTIKDIFKGESLPEYNAAQLQIMQLPQGQEREYAIGTPLKEGKLVPLELEQIKERQLGATMELGRCAKPS